MTTDTLPKWNFRLDAEREHGFGDLLPILNSHYRVHESAEAFLGPYNARQRSSGLPYQAPDKELLKQCIKQGAMNDFSYQAYLNSIVRFCEQTKGMRGLPHPHPSTIHSIQLPLPAFEIENDRAGSAVIRIIGSPEPIKVSKFSPRSDVKFIIVRPKLSKLGTASANNWEVLFFYTAHGYIPNWADSDKNPRWSGRY